MTLKNSTPGLFDGKEIVVQTVEKEDCLTDNDLIVHIRRIYPNNSQLGKVEEFIIQKDISIVDLQQRLCQHSGIPEESLQISKTSLTQVIEQFSDTKNLTWKNSLPAKDNENTKLASFMWFVADGDTFVYRDATEVPADENAATLQNSSQSSVVSTASTAPKSHKKPSYRTPERGITIKTKFDKVSLVTSSKESPV